jgi:hypothetical protein
MNNAGDIAELAFIHQAYKRNYKAFIPYSHDCKMDVIIKRPGEPLISVQVKKGVKQKLPDHYVPAWKAPIGSLQSSTRRCDKGPRFTPYKQGAFDVLAVYIQEIDGFALWRLSDLADRKSLRWTPKKPINNWELITDFFKP